MAAHTVEQQPQSTVQHPTRRLSVVVDRWLGLADVVDRRIRNRSRWTCVLVVVAGCLLVTMNQINAVLERMAAIGEEPGGALSFALPRRAERLANAWRAYDTDPNLSHEAVAGTTALHGWLFLLDLLFIMSYVPLLAVLLAAARRILRDERPRAEGPREPDLLRARRRLVDGALVALPLLAVVDVAEDMLLYLGYAHHVDTVLKAGFLFTGSKLILGAVVVLALFLFAGAEYADERLRAPVVSSRGVTVVVGMLAALLVVMPLGAQQVDDVVRAWTWLQMLSAVVATTMAMIVVVGAVRALTTTSREHLTPDEGDHDPQQVLLAAGLVLTAVGVAMFLSVRIWGLIVPGVMLLVIWAGGLIVEPSRVRRCAPRDRDTRNIGEPLARVLGATVCAVAIWTTARAAAFDLFVRNADPRLGWDAKILVAVIALAVVAVVIDRWPSWTERAWKVVAALAFGALWSTVIIPVDLLGVELPTWIGSVAVVMIGVAAGAGGLAWISVLARHPRFKNGRDGSTGSGSETGSQDGWKLPRLFRLMNLSRFPGVTLVVVWVLLVAYFDNGGFHDIRRISTNSGLGTPPSLEQAYEQWATAQPAVAGRARPMVFVAAQGGGIRAAVWTALVMECVFGPTPVKGGGGICADGTTDDLKTAATDVRDRALPVFVASGASGGSVGLAAWTARRVDLVEANGPPADLPTRIDAILPADYVAPDVTRLLSGDALYLLLAQHAQDRAALLERSWEQAWGAADGAGLSRGMRESWKIANGAPGQWRVPVVAFNGSQVEDGCRFVTSPVDMLVSRVGDRGDTSQPVDLTGASDLPDDADCGRRLDTADFLASGRDALPATTELIDYLCPNEDVPMSTAAHLSARFPYVSPTARVVAADQRCSGLDRRGLLPEGAVSSVTDGGVADNSGSSTAVQLYRALQPRMAADEAARRGCVVPIFLQIDNSVADEPQSGAGDPPFELTAPAKAVWDRQNAQQGLDREEARQAFGELQSAGGQRVGGSSTGWFRIAPSLQPGYAPPLGWTLSAETVQDMRQQMLSGTNATDIRALRRLLTTPLTCSTP